METLFDLLLTYSVFISLLYANEMYWNKKIKKHQDEYINNSNDHINNLRLYNDLMKERLYLFEALVRDEISEEDFKIKIEEHYNNFSSLYYKDEQDKVIDEVNKILKQ